MDVVKVIFPPRPQLVFKIVDFEADVVRNPDALNFNIGSSVLGPHRKDSLIPRRLDRGQICPDHHGFRILIGHFNRPNTGPCPKIQDLLGILQRGQM